MRRLPGHTWLVRIDLPPFHLVRRKNPSFDFESAYFEHSYDAVFGVVHRPTFESRLRAHFRLGNASRVDDPSWYALRNIVYAAGCRSLLAKDSNLSFVEAAAKSRQYFQTALSVFNAIIFGRSGFTAIQALLLMVSAKLSKIKMTQVLTLTPGNIRRRAWKPCFRVPDSHQRRSIGSSTGSPPCTLKILELSGSRCSK